MMSAGTSDKQRVLKRQRNVRLAQLDRAFGYGPKGRGFESSNARTVTVLVKTRTVFSYTEGKIKQAAFWSAARRPHFLKKSWGNNLYAH